MSFAMYKLVLIASIFLIVTGILLTAFSLFSPLWQVAVLPTSYVTHQHGLWWDCVVSMTSPEERIIPLDELDREIRGDKCVSKFDPSLQTQLRTALEQGDAASRELLLHRFLPHHKAVVFFSVFTFLFGVIGILIGACSPCFPPNSLLYVVAIFMTTVFIRKYDVFLQFQVACSILADIIFVFASNKEENTIEPRHTDSKNDLSGYHQTLGFACYIHMIASAVFVSALFFSILSSYLLISSNKGHDGCCTSKREYTEQNRWRVSGAVVRSYERKTCRPFVVVDDDSL